MSGPITTLWRLNRWFDDLLHEGRGTERGLWALLLLFAIWVPPLPLKMAGYHQDWIEAVTFALCLLIGAVRLSRLAIADRVELG